MIPVKSNTKHSNDCLPTSSNCVIWEGVDIPCIKLCKGDTVTDVIYKQSKLLCELSENFIDLSTLDFDCVLPNGDTAPGDIQSALQLMINKICSLQTHFIGNEIPEGDADLVPLPFCLYYNDGNGDPVHTLPMYDYVILLASKICELVLLIAGNTSDITALDVRVTALETAINDTSVLVINITTQCASSNTPGQSIPIITAFYNLEGVLCQYIGTLGTTGALTASIGKQCSGLADLFQLSDNELLMSDIAGWVYSPSTIADTINNMWLTICDMRTKMLTCCIDSPLGCIAVMPVSVTIESLSTTTFSIAVSPPVVVGESPDSYFVEIYQWNGSAITGSAVHSGYHTLASPIVISNSSYTIDQEYKIFVQAHYSSCGLSSAETVIGVLHEPYYPYYIRVVDASTDDDGTVACSGGDPVPQQKRTLNISLRSTLTDALVVNSTLDDIVVECRIYGVTADCDEVSTAPVENFINYTIPGGSSNTDHIYDYNTFPIYCVASSVCISTLNTFNCATIFSLPGSLTGLVTLSDDTPECILAP